MLYYYPYTLTVVSLHLGRMALVPHTRTVSPSAWTLCILIWLPHWKGYTKDIISAWENWTYVHKLCIFTLTLCLSCLLYELFKFCKLYWILYYLLYHKKQKFIVIINTIKILSPKLYLNLVCTYLSPLSSWWFTYYIQQ